MVSSYQASTSIPWVDGLSTDTPVLGRHIEGESQVWWDWVKTSRDLEAMTWAEFHGLLMSKYFSATARHAKALEFLELRQGTMTVMEYMARFTELAHFSDDYVATDMAKVRRFENGLKLSIRGKIVGLHLQDMDSFGRRERDGGRTRHSGCECRWEKERGSAFSEFGLRG